MDVAKVLSSSLTHCQQTKCPSFIRYSRQGAEAISLKHACVKLEKGYFPKKRLKSSSNHCASSVQKYRLVTKRLYIVCWHIFRRMEAFSKSFVQPYRACTKKGFLICETGHDSVAKVLTANIVVCA